MLRAAPDHRGTKQLARGIAAYHLDLFERRWHGPSVRVRAMALRNLAAAALSPVAGAVASVFPRHVPSPLPARPASLVE
jgi:hypothetical protein